MSAKVHALYQKRENISISHATPITPIVLLCKICEINRHIVVDLVDFQMILTRGIGQKVLTILIVISAVIHIPTPRNQL